MQQNVNRGMVAALTLLFVMLQTASTQDQKWFDSPHEAANVASLSGKLTKVSVVANWCHYYKNMDRETWTNGKV